MKIKKNKRENRKKKKNRKKKLIKEIVYSYANPLMISAFYFCIECIRNMYLIFRNVRTKKEIRSLRQMKRAKYMQQMRRGTYK